MKQWIAENGKALTAFFGVVIAQLLVRYGLKPDDAVTTSLSTMGSALVVSLIVWWITNSAPQEPKP